MMNLLSPGFTLPEACRSLLQEGIGLLVQSTLILLAGLLAGSALRRRGASAPLLVYKTTLVGVILGAMLSIVLAGSLRPLWTLTLPAIPTIAATLPQEETVTASIGMPNSAAKAVAPTAAHSASAMRAAPPGSPPEPARSPRFHPIEIAYMALTGAWGAGTLLLLGWLGLCHLRLLCLRKECAPVSDAEVLSLHDRLCRSLRVRPPLLLASAHVRSPFLAVSHRPVIFLPASYAADFDGPALRAVLAHELVHLARRDCWWYLLARLACAVGWTQPLLWVLCRRLEHAGEEVCDQEVIRQECSPRAYADCLVSLAERLVPSRPERAVGAGVLPFRSSLGRRVATILDTSRHRAGPLSGSVRAAVAIGIFTAVSLGLFLFAAGEQSRRGAQDGPTGAKRPSGVVAGRVLYEDGRRASGIHVAAWRKPLAQLPGGIRTYRDDDSIPPYSGAITGADGSYRLQGVGTSSYDIYVTPTKLSPMFVAAALKDVAAQEGKTVHVPDLVLTPGAIVTGTVVDQAIGTPLEGIYVAADGPERPQDTGLTPRFEKTDAQGRYSLRVAPGKNRIYVAGPLVNSQPGGALPVAYAIQVVAKRGETKTVSFRVSGQVVAAGTLTGRVVYQDSRPAQGVRVMAQINDSAYQGSTPPDPTISWSEAVSSADGSYRLTGLGNVRYNVTVEEKSGLWVAAAHEGAHVNPGQTAPLPDLMLTHGAIVTGVVTDTADGKPLVGVQIGSYGPHRPRSSAMIISADTDMHGRYSLRVAPGRSYIYIAMEGAGEGVEVTLAEGMTKTLPFRVDARAIGMTKP